jgi:D-galactarolactone cycloisomerase
MELDRTENALRDELTEPLLVPQNGLLKVPEKPGLGVDVNEEMLEKYRIDKNNKKKIESRSFQIL